jgi:hypothetical protein
MEAGEEIETAGETTDSEEIRCILPCVLSEIYV